MSADLNCFNIDDLRRKARRRLPKGIWEYLERGVEDETGMARNRAGFEALSFVPRVLRNVEDIKLSNKVFGKTSALPIAIAPTGAAGLMWHKGDLHLASAAAKADIPFTISSASTMELEDIAAIGGRQWFQLYLWQNRELSFSVVERAHQAGCEALMVTLDLPVAPNREYLFHNGFGIPFALNRHNIPDIATHPRWLCGVILRYLLQDFSLPTQANLPAALRNSIARGSKPGARFKQDNLDWDGICEFRDRWPGKFVLKGVLHPEDARQAVEIGVDAIVVSNHGARSLDHSIASIEALPSVAKAVGGKAEIILDSGIRRGSDVVKALALGADCVMVGRAPIYGLSAAGEAGVTRAIDLLGAEIRRTMAYLGLTTIEQIDRDIFAPANLPD